jgi:hypothetical protein
MNEKFSIIIPTMWVPKMFVEAIKEYLKSSLVGEIIIIDNNPKSRPNLPNDNRIKILTKGYNIFVNPAWNWGVKETKNENVLIINDDLYVKNISDILKVLLETKFDFVGLDYKNLNLGYGIIVKEKKEDMTNGFGCFLFIKKSKYITIPKDIKIWYGDRILFNSIPNKGEISFDGVQIELSKTINSSNHFIDTINEDRKNFKKWISTVHQKNLF